MARKQGRSSGTRGGKGKTGLRPLVATVSITVDVPAEMSDKEILAQLKNLRAHWTNATYTTGPNGTVVDEIAGLDV